MTVDAVHQTWVYAQGRYVHSTLPRRFYAQPFT